MVSAIALRQRLFPRHGGWTATLIAAASYLAVVIVTQSMLPAVDEVPAGFPADVLWNFRLASLGVQLVMWATIGLVFGWLTERATAVRRQPRPVIDSA
jgi:predicted cobalt transporter CbtA